MKNRIIVSLLSLSLAFSGWAMAMPPKSAPELIREIVDVTGLKANFEVKAANVPNAAAVVYGGKRFILYNPNFIAAINRNTGTEWAAISVLAHEVGHHLDGHTLSGSGSKPETELEADEFSGFVLRKMGATLTQAQAAMKLAASERQTSTHPGQYDRLTAIANGWNKAEGQLTGKPFTPQPIEVASARKVASAPSTSTVQVTASLPDKFIIGDVRFASDAASKYFITERYNLVKLQNNQFSVVGKITNLNSNRFPYLIYDESNTQLLVDTYGNIVTRQGRQVGKMTARKA